MQMTLTSNCLKNLVNLINKGNITKTFYFQILLVPGEKCSGTLNDNTTAKHGWKLVYKFDTLPSECYCLNNRKSALNL